MVSMDTLLASVSAEQAVQLAVRLLHAYHEQEAERLSLALAGKDRVYMEQLATRWKILRDDGHDPSDALDMLIGSMIEENMNDGRGGDIPDRL